MFKLFQGYNDDAGYGMFQTNGADKWDNWVENGKYLIAYNHSEFGKLERKTIKKALETLESKTHLKFVKYDLDTRTLKYDRNTLTCPPVPKNPGIQTTHPCNWYMKFVRSEGILKSIITLATRKLLDIRGPGSGLYI